MAAAAPTRAGAPAIAILLQGLAATAIASIGQYEQLLSYEVSVDFIAFALAAAALFIFRRKNYGAEAGRIYLAPGHPYTTALFVAVCMVIVASTVLTYPGNSFIALFIMLTGVPVYWFWRQRHAMGVDKA